MDKPSFEYVNGKVAGVDTKVGTLSNLQTTAKTDLVSAVNELFTSVSNGKSAVASAITDKGVTTAADATFAVMAANILAIPTGSTPTGTKQISITQNGVTTEDVASYANAEITVNVGSTPTNYRAGSFTLTSEIAGTAVKVVNLDADALSHKDDQSLILAILVSGGTSINGSLGCIVSNGVFNGTRYGFGLYQAASGGNLSSNVITTAANVAAAAGIGRAYIGTDGIYIIGSTTYKWKPGIYNYAIVWGGDSQEGEEEANTFKRWVFTNPSRITTTQAVTLLTDSWLAQNYDKANLEVSVICRNKPDVTDVTNVYFIKTAASNTPFSTGTSYCQFGVRAGKSNFYGIGHTSTLAGDTVSSRGMIRLSSTGVLILRVDSNCCLEAGDYEIIARLL